MKIKTSTCKHYSTLTKSNNFWFQLLKSPTWRGVKCTLPDLLKIRVPSSLHPTIYSARFAKYILYNVYTVIYLHLSTLYYIYCTVYNVHTSRYTWLCTRTCCMYTVQYTVYYSWCKWSRILWLILHFVFKDQVTHCS